ncbi:hypothetical protein F7725_003895 [Dissostichus mawsoni]|uniref:Uncharacterized protein n=1 Tax=Dissostichus mawsoni TaxID=36200 RepID=A0A7J5YE43_DISMA|nr:hypothetical protein F7725_003895 [Dissostichus mawsoni]
MSDAGLLETLLRRIEAADGGVDSLETASILGVDHQVLVGAVKSLLALEDVSFPGGEGHEVAELRSSKHWELSGEGTEIAEQGSHEARKLSFGKIGFSKAMSNKWIKVDKTHEGGPRIFRSVENIEDQSYWITKGSCFSTTITKPETELTPEMIANGSWKEKKFKPYNFEALGVAPDCGHLHPLMKPQQHPARDAHDTFFISDPALAHQFPLEYLERVKKIHSEGGYGSQG